MGKTVNREILSDAVHRAVGLTGHESKTLVCAPARPAHFSVPFRTKVDAPLDGILFAGAILGWCWLGGPRLARARELPSDLPPDG
jgi:hypothetical protein